MTGNRVETVIVAKDQASKVFNNIGASMRNNVAIGTVMGNAITASLGAAIDAAKGLVSVFNDAAQVNLSNIGTAGDMAKLTGMSFADAQKDITEFTNRMSIAAADLPGDTASFVG